MRSVCRYLSSHHECTEPSPATVCRALLPPKKKIYPNDLGAKQRRASLREVLHVRNVEGISQSCIGAQGTKAPSVQPDITIELHEPVDGVQLVIC